MLRVSGEPAERTIHSLRTRAGVLRLRRHAGAGRDAAVSAVPGADCGVRCYAIGHCWMMLAGWTSSLQ